NDVELERCRVERKLDIAAALHTQRPDDAERRGTQQLVLPVGKRLAWRDDDAIAGMDAQRVEVLHVADSDAAVGADADHLILDLLPSSKVVLDQHLADGAGGQT